MQYFQYLIFRVFLFFLSLLPFRVLYFISDILKWLLKDVVKYRKNLIQQNLINSFPEKNSKEISAILKKSYKNLADIMVEGMIGITLNDATIKKRYKFINPEILDEAYNNGVSVILLTGHYNNWEWGALSPPFFFKHQVVGLYKKLSNKYLDQHFQNTRSKTGIILDEISDTAQSFEKHTTAERPALFLMAADQSPSNTSKAYWVDFLKQDTPCLHGPEKYSKKYNLPIVYCDIQRTKRGFYKLKLSWLIKKPEHAPEGEITKMFMLKLEEIIKKEPGNWLWSHKRWKHKRNYE